MNRDNAMPREITSLVAFVDEYFNDKFSDDEADQTVGICLGVFGTVISLVEGLSACMAVPAYTAIYVLYRSIIEYTIDLRYIGLKKNPEVNGLFLNYMKLKAYFLRNRISTNKDQLPQIETEYRAYVKESFPDVIAEHSKMVEGRPSINWSAVDNVIKKKYRGSWAGLNTSDRLDEVHAIERKEMAQDDSGFLKDAPVFEHEYDLYSFASNFTHVTPMSALPHFDPSTKEFRASWEFSERAQAQWENYRRFLVMSTLFGLSCVLSLQERLEFLRAMTKYIHSKPDLSSYYFKGALPHATSPGNE